MSQNLRALARKTAEKRGLNPDIFERQIQQESGFQTHIGSPAGAQGIAQIMPATARAWGVNPNDPVAALDAAASHMAAYVKKFGNYEDALRAYNAGEGAVKASRGYAETNNYVKTILGGHDPGKLGTPSSGGGAAAAPAHVDIGTRQTFDSAGFEAARKQSIVAQLLQHTRPQSPLLRLGVLNPAMPDRSSFTGAETTSKVVGGTKAAAPSRSGKVLVVGDSLGVGTVPHLKKTLGSRVTADTRVGRSSAQGIDVLRRELARGQHFSQIVLDLGTNDSSAAQLAASVKEARRLAPNATIYIPTVNGPAAAQKNELLRRVAGGNVHLVNWSKQSSGLIGGDGIHATGSGYAKRADILLHALGDAPAAPAAPSRSTGSVRVASGANRPGVALQRPVLDFLGQLAGVMGRPVDVTTGTNHNQYVLGTHNESDHWTGNATDLGMGGDARQSEAVRRKGDLVAAHAIQIAGGVSFKDALAMAQKGGVWNFQHGGHRVQILWKTMTGGNHFNHVHVGVR